MTLQYPCVSCKKPVKNNQRGLQCTYCLTWMHTACAGVRNEQYDDVHYEFLNWRCTKCILEYLPFYGSSFNESSYVKTQTHNRMFRRRPQEMIPQSHVRFMTSLTIMISKCTHINIRSLYRNIDEIRDFLHNNDIIFWP